MDSVEDIPDSSDWLNTPVAPLSAVESALRCEVCKDFYKDPVITSCSHTFCALCIRRCLSANGKCPLCWTADEERRLRKNPVVGDLVKAFQTARPEILRLGRHAVEFKNQSAQPESGRKRKRSNTHVEDETVTGRVTRSRGRKSPRIESSQTPEQEISVDEEDIEDPAFRPEDNGLAACPICQIKMPEAEVFLHLDTHQDGSPAPKPVMKALPLGLNQRSPQRPSHTATMTHLPTLAYGLLSETQLRKKLTELRIPAWGNKEVMKQRHIEWRNIINANCDSSTPQPRRDLLRDLDDWEKTKGKNPNAIMAKDFDRDAWSSSNEGQFQDLVAMARAKRKAPEVKEVDVAGDTPEGSGEAAPEPSLAGVPITGTEPLLEDGPDGPSHFPIIID